LKKSEKEREDKRFYFEDFTITIDFENNFREW